MDFDSSEEEDAFQSLMGMRKDASFLLLPAIARCTARYECTYTITLLGFTVIIAAIVFTTMHQQLQWRVNHSRQTVVVQ